MLAAMIFIFTLRLVLEVFFQLLLGAQPTRALVENRTIDDHYGDIVTGALPIYQGPRGWNLGPLCTGCGVQPSKLDTFDQTWHDCTAEPTDPSPWNVTLTFDGTAIWVYFIMCNIIRTGLGVNTNLTFILDGHPSGTYRHIANPNGPDFEYNVTVFSSQNLAESQHTLVVSTVGQGEPDGALALFDWAMYTYANDTETSSVSPGGNQLTSGSIGYPSNTVTESVPYHISTTTGEAPSSTLSDNTNSATSRSPVATLVGALVGGIAGLLALILAFLYLCRRIRGRAASPSSSAPSTTYQTTSTNAVSMGHPLQTAYAPAVRPPFSRKVLHDMRSGNMRDADPPPSAANHSTAASVTPFPETSMRSYPSTMILPRDNLRGHRGSFLQQADAVKFVAGTVPDEQNVGTVEGSTSADQSVSAFTTVHDSSDLQRRIDMLQAEMDRMRADVAPPPAYDFEEGR